MQLILRNKALAALFHPVHRRHINIGSNPTKGVKVAQTFTDSLALIEKFTNCSLPYFDPHPKGAKNRNSKRAAIASKTMSDENSYETFRPFLGLDSQLNAFSRCTDSHTIGFAWAAI